MSAPPPFRPTVNLRYTVGNQVMLLRGLYDNGNEDMVRVCRTLTSMDEFRRGYSAGDAGIMHCARTGTDHGQSPKWREWDHNHHFEETMDRVSNLA